jgi:hypothetical protein
VNLKKNNLRTLFFFKKSQISSDFDDFPPKNDEISTNSAFLASANVLLREISQNLGGKMPAGPFFFRFFYMKIGFFALKMGVFVLKNVFFTTRNVFFFRFFLFN